MLNQVHHGDTPAYRRQGGHREKEFLFVPRSSRDKQKAFQPHPGRLLAEGPGVHGESAPPPYTSRDLRPILHENISLSVLCVSNEPPIFSGRVGGEDRLKSKLSTVLVIGQENERLKS